MHKPTLALIFVSLFGCTPSPGVTLPSPFEQGGVRVTVDGLFSLSSGAVSGVGGVAENVSGRDFRTCMVTLEFVNAAGEKVGDAIASTLNLSRGQKWRFQPAVTSLFQTSFQAVRAGRVQCF